MSQILSLYDISNNVVSLVTVLNNLLLGTETKVDSLLHTTYDSVIGGYVEPNIRADSYITIEPDIVKKSLIKFDEVVSECINCLKKSATHDNESIRSTYIPRIKQFMFELYQLDCEILTLAYNLQSGRFTKQTPLPLDGLILEQLFHMIDAMINRSKDLYDIFSTHLIKLHELFLQHSIIQLSTDVCKSVTSEKTNDDIVTVTWTSDVGFRIKALRDDLLVLIDSSQERATQKNIITLIRSVVNLAVNQEIYPKLLSYDVKNQCFILSKNRFEQWLSEHQIKSDIDHSVTKINYQKLRSQLYDVSIGHIYYDELVSSVQLVKDSFLFADETGEDEESSTPTVVVSTVHRILKHMGESSIDQKKTVSYYFNQSEEIKISIPKLSNAGEMKNTQVGTWQDKDSILLDEHNNLWTVFEPKIVNYTDRIQQLYVFVNDKDDVQNKTVSIESNKIDNLMLYKNPDHLYMRVLKASFAIITLAAGTYTSYMIMNQKKNKFLLDKSDL